MTGNDGGGEAFAPPLLELHGITKSFGALRANDGIDLDVRQGEVHALLGENGAGKTTLMNILYGLVHPDAGEILLNGVPIRITSPRAAIRHHIGMVHQHFMLIPNLTVVENVILGLPVEREPFLDLRAATARLRNLSDEYGLAVDPTALVANLPVGVQQRIEILKALYRGAELLVLDEPTAVLSPGEIHDFFRVLKGLVAKGLSAIFISHKLEEVLEVSQRITVLRRGRKVGTIAVDQASLQVLAEMMVGRQVVSRARPQPHPFGPPILRVDGIEAVDDGGQPALKEVSFQVRGGEVLGIAGVDGNGQQQLAEVLAGLRPARAGRITVSGTDLTGCPPEVFIRHGVGYVPADRQNVGLILDFSVDENLVIKRSDQPAFSRHGVLRPTAIHGYARRVVDAYDIRDAGQETRVRQLSGGNQQKVVLAREIEDGPVLMVAVHPTRGMDIGATEYVQQRILEQRDQGVAVVLISSELEELLLLADRIAVMFRGEIMGILPGDGASVEVIGRMMLGQREDLASQEGGGL